jgi:lipid-binding SYLF domain-containing protein
MRLRQFTISAIAFFLTIGVAHAASKEEARVLDSTDIVDQLLRIPEQGIPARLLSRASAIAVIPRVLKIGFGVGGRHGRGILVVRQDDNTWSNPAFIRITGGSFGFQAGAQSTDIILVFKNRSSVDGIASGKMTLGADASVAAGPVGRSAEAATDWTFKSEVFSYSRSRGLFAGVALQGAGLTMDRKANAAFYGDPGITPEQIFASSGNAAPAAANNFVQVLTAHTQGLPVRPAAAAAAASSKREVYPQEQSRSEVRTYGMNANPDDDISN